MYGTAQRFGLGDALDDVAVDASEDYAQDPKLAQLHQLAVLIVALRQTFNNYLNAASNADADFDPATLTAIAQQLQSYVDQFRSLRGSIDHSTASMYALSTADQAILDAGTWAQQALAALPNAIAAIPNALVNALGNIATNTGKQVAKSIAVPAALIGGGILAAIWLVKQAEQTRTGRALARHV